MKALNIALLIVAILILVAVVWRAAGGRLPHWREHFDNVNYLTVTWAPPASYPFPANLVYNWAFCMQPGTGCNPYENTGMCPSPLGDPSTWTYHGTVSTPSLTLNSASCEYCIVGCKATLMLQAVDNVTKIAGQWVATTIDLTSPTPKSVSITDASGQPLAEGSTGFIYTLSIDPDAFASGNQAVVYGTLIRGESGFGFAGYVPFTSVNNGTGTFAGSLTASALWKNGQAPGPMQVNDTLTIQAQVFSPDKGGPIYYWGGFTVTAQTITPGSPAQVSWVLA
jgi:hypothetical protein